MSEGATPSMDEQCRIITCLVDEEPTSTYAYFVSAEWYNKWQSYVGYKTQQTPDEAERPGSLTMRWNHNGAVFVDGRQNVGHQCRTIGTIIQYVHGERPAAIRPNQGDDGRNMLVDEKIWRKWVQWYGVADSHELDRRRLADSRQALLEMRLLNPYSTLVKKPKKVFDITEELQLRRIFGVTAGRKTKLWVCDNTTDQFFQQVLGRNTPFSKLNSQRGRPNSVVDVSSTFTIALELCRTDGTWHTSGPVFTREYSNEYFEKYLPLIEGPLHPGSKEEDLAMTVKSMFAGFNSTLQATVVGVIELDAKMKQVSKNQKEI
ncbi:hypothetical protein LSAT2_009216, partial [Lamellibrachia satsuma]